MSLTGTVVQMFLIVVAGLGVASLLYRVVTAQFRIARAAKVDTFKGRRREEGLRPLCLTSAEMFAQQGADRLFLVRVCSARISYG